MKKTDLIPKTDIKQLIQLSKFKNKIIDHPHARYNSLGRISCIACGVQIKSELAWNAHVLSKSHKNNAERGISLQKRSINTNCKSEIPEKKAKVETKQPKPGHPEIVNDSDDDDSLSNSQDSKPATVSADFFDTDKLGEKNPAEKTQHSNSNSAIPEGFFDDSYKDAKVRNVPFKDKISEELAIFQKELVALEKESEDLMEKEIENIVSERNLHEIDEQIRKWERIKQLEQEKDQYEMRVKNKLQYKNTKVEQTIKQEPTTNRASSSEDDETDYLNEFNNFRNKSSI